MAPSVVPRVRPPNAAAERVRMQSIAASPTPAAAGRGVETAAAVERAGGHDGGGDGNVTGGSDESKRLGGSEVEAASWSGDGDKSVPKMVPFALTAADALDAAIAWLPWLSTTSAIRRQSEHPRCLLHLCCTALLVPALAHCLQADTGTHTHDLLPVEGADPVATFLPFYVHDVVVSSFLVYAAPRSPLLQLTGSLFVHCVSPRA